MENPKKTKSPKTAATNVSLTSVLNAASNSVAETPEVTVKPTVKSDEKVKQELAVKIPPVVKPTTTTPSAVVANNPQYSEESSNTLQNRIKEAEFLDVFIDLDKFWVKLLENNDKLQTHMMLKKLICPKTGIINHRFAQAFAFTGLKHLGEEVPQFVKKSFTNNRK